MGPDPAGDDLDRVAAVRDALGPAGRIRIDANASWDADDAVLALLRLANYDLELAEQPVESSSTTWPGSGARCPVPVAADESVRGRDRRRVPAALAAADALVVKTQPLGGVRAALADHRGGRRPRHRLLPLRDVGRPGRRAGPGRRPPGAALRLRPRHRLAARPPTSWPTRWCRSAGMLAVRRPVPDPDLLAKYGVPLDDGEWPESGYP